MSQIPAKVMGYRLEQKLDLAAITISDYYRTYFKADRTGFLIPDPETLLNDYQMAFGQLEPFSVLLTEEAELYLLTGRTEQARMCFGKALEILEYVNEKDKVNYAMDRLPRIKALQSRLTEWLASNESI